MNKLSVKLEHIIDPDRGVRYMITDTNNFTHDLTDQINEIVNKTKESELDRLRERLDKVGLN